MKKLGVKLRLKKPVAACRWCGTVTAYGLPDGSCSFECGMQHRMARRWAKGGPRTVAAVNVALAGTLKLEVQEVAR